MNKQGVGIIREGLCTRPGVRVGCGPAPQVGDSQELTFGGLPGRPRGQRRFLMLQRRVEQRLG